MILQDKINQFINRAQSKITELCIDTASNLNEAYSDNRDIVLVNELSDAISCFQDELLDWNDYEKELVVDYYNYRANLINIPIVTFNDLNTYIVNGAIGSTGNAWVDPLNALSKVVNSNHQTVLDEIDRLDDRIDGLDFSTLIPQEILDEIDANTTARHTHSNKPILDSVTQDHLDSIASNTAHRNNSSLHVTAAEKTVWNGKVSTTQLADGLATKAPLVHTHPFSDIPGLTDAFATLAPEKGDKGDRGDTPIFQVGTVTDGENLEVRIDNASTLYPVINFVIPLAEDGEDFKIDKYGISSERLRSTYNDVEEGYTYLGTDNGILYFRKPFDESSNPISAITTSGWYGVQFMGKDGWSPELSASVIDDTKTVLVLKGWMGGTGVAPSLDITTYTTYLGRNGYTYNIADAINIKGTQGIKGDAGKIMFPDLAGGIAERDTVDTAPKDFIFLDNVNGVIYRKLSASVGDWSTGYQWKGDKGDKGDPGESTPVEVQVFEKAEFIPQITAPDHKEGVVFFDDVEDALVYYNSVSGLANQIGRELWVRVKNQNGYVIPNGTVVYINGAYDAFPTVDLADCKDYTKSRVIGITTMDITGNGGIGYVTFFGRVSTLNTVAWEHGTILYLNPNVPGGFTNTTPTGGNFKVRLGVVTRQSATEGTIDVSVYSNEYSVETISERGFPEKSELTLGFDNSTRTISLTPTVNKYRFYIQGNKFTKTSVESIVLPADEGVYVVYYNASGVLSYLYNPTITQLVGLIETYPLVAYVYWDATNSRATFVGNELHWSKGYGIRNHVKDHLTQGAVFGTGFEQTDDVTTGNGSLATDAQFGVTTGSMYDEDILHTLPGFISTVGVTRVLYTSSLGYPRYSKLTGFSVLTTGTGRLAYNPLNNGLVECGDNTYVWYHLFASGTVVTSEGLCTFVGRSNYISRADAYEGLSVDLVNIQRTALPSPEFVPIASRLYQTRNTYTNAVKARLVPADTNNSLFVDWRYSKLIGSSGVGGGSGTIIPEFTDAEFKLMDNVDTTKVAMFQVENISANNTREFVFPDKNGTFAMVSDIIVYNQGDILPSTAGYKSGDEFLHTTNMIRYKVYDDTVQKIWIEI